MHRLLDLHPMGVYCLFKMIIVVEPKARGVYKVAGIHAVIAFWFFAGRQYLFFKLGTVGKFLYKLATLETETLYTISRVHRAKRRISWRDIVILAAWVEHVDPLVDHKAISLKKRLLTWAHIDVGPIFFAFVKHPILLNYYGYCILFQHLVLHKLAYFVFLIFLQLRHFFWKDWFLRKEMRAKRRGWPVVGLNNVAVIEYFMKIHHFTSLSFAHASLFHEFVLM